MKAKCVSLAMTGLIALIAMFTGAPSAAWADDHVTRNDGYLASFAPIVVEEPTYKDLLTGSFTLTAVPHQCASGWICLYQDTNFQGRMLAFQDSVAHLSSYGFNDKMSSWKNLRAVDARWFYHAPFSGPSYCMQAHSSSRSVGGGNDEASSMRVYPTASAC